MLHTWKLSNFPCIYVLFSAKIGKIQKTGLSPSKPGFVGQDSVGSYGFFLRFSNRGHSLAESSLS